MGKYGNLEIGETVVTDNGMLFGPVMVNGKKVYRFQGAAPGLENQEKRRSSASKRRGRKPMTAKQAMRAMKKHYKNKAYNSDKGRKSAMTRDLCWDNQPMVNDSRYKRSPHKYDFAGVDDGSNCPSGQRKGSKKRMTEKQKANLRKGREALARKRAAQRGGAKKPVSLKTAVRLLRQYYENKYE